MLTDGTSLLFREYAPTNGMVNLYQSKETAMFETLASVGLPAPRVLAWAPGDRSSGEAPATLLSDGGGDPLDELMRSVAVRRRPALWSEVGVTLRRLHDLDPESAPILREIVYQRPWTRFVPYFLKSLKQVESTRPDLAGPIAQLRAMRRRLSAYLDSRPDAICCAGAGGQLPGMLLRAEGGGFHCASWLNLGYYVSITDPDHDLMQIVVSHREWTGDDVPTSFFRAYGSRPDPAAALIYGAALQWRRGAAYLRGGSRWGPPPHSTAIDALDRLPETVDALKALL